MMLDIWSVVKHGCSVHNAHRIEMRGEFMRKKRNPPRDESDEKKE